MQKYEYKLEELMTVFQNLAIKCMGADSSSITYEKAKQLKEAIEYCINELNYKEDMKELTNANLSAEAAYEMGYKMVMKKVKDALELYEKIAVVFNDYGNKCLKETVMKGYPEFFKWYDVKFAPQDTILMLDYPILVDTSKYSGIDAIYIYLKCIEIEQFFLDKFEYEYVISVLDKYDLDYRNMIDNLLYVILRDVIYRKFSVNDKIIKENLSYTASFFLDKLVDKYYNGRQDVKKYLEIALKDIIIRI